MFAAGVSGRVLVVRQTRRFVTHGHGRGAEAVAHRENPQRDDSSAVNAINARRPPADCRAPVQTARTAASPIQPSASPRLLLPKRAC